jgi:hypothetical protein
MAPKRNARESGTTSAAAAAATPSMQMEDEEPATSRDEDAAIARLVATHVEHAVDEKWQVFFQRALGVSAVLDEFSTQVEHYRHTHEQQAHKIEDLEAAVAALQLAQQRAAPPAAHPPAARPPATMTPELTAACKANSLTGTQCAVAFAFVTPIEYQLASSTASKEFVVLDDALQAKVEEHQISEQGFFCQFNKCV